jgi:hypothetical protein
MALRLCDVSELLNGGSTETGDSRLHCTVHCALGTSCLLADVVYAVAGGGNLDWFVAALIDISGGQPQRRGGGGGVGRAARSKACPGCCAGRRSLQPHRLACREGGACLTVCRAPRGDKTAGDPSPDWSPAAAAAAAAAVWYDLVNAPSLTLVLCSDYRRECDTIRGFIDRPRGRDGRIEYVHTCQSTGRWPSSQSIPRVIDDL